MTVNNYFQRSEGTSNEQDLAESNIIELIQMTGFDCYYMPRTMFASDTLFHEVPADKFESSHTIEMYINNVSDFNGNGDLMSKFGIQIDDQIEFVVSRTRFTEETSMERPLEGDLVYFPLTKHLFEVDWVEDEPGTVGSVNQFYQLGKLYTYVFKCTLFSPSYEEFDTSVSEVDTALDPDTYEPTYGNNEDINDEADDSLSWTESNPFGKTTE
jgi:hypothetical protein